MRFRFVVTALVAGLAMWWVWGQWSDDGSGDDAAKPAKTANRDATQGRNEKVASVRSVPPAGTKRTLTLITTNAADYMAPVTETDADEAYAKIISSLDQRDVTYDRHLARAATEFAAQNAVLGEPPPSEAIQFLLHAAGAPEYNAAQYYLSTTSDDAAALAQAVKGALKDLPGGTGSIIVGVGEAVAPGSSHQRRVCVLVARRGYALHQTARTAQLNSNWVAKGRLPDGYRKPHATVLYPDGDLREVRVQTNGREFSLTVPTRRSKGRMYVGIDGVGAGGPGKLLQLSVDLGQPLRKNAEFISAGPEPSFDSLKQAEAYAFRLLNADRTRLGLPALEYDDRLAAIARAHSKDMNDASFFGHRSPTTGLAGDRVLKAEYRASAHAENLAENQTLNGAEASLMNSVGHRRNILGKSSTHVGVGIARRRRKSGEGWIVTQMFARKVVDIDEATARVELVKQINAARRAAGAGGVTVRRDLSVAAKDGAQRAANGELKGIARDVLSRVRALVDKEASVSTHVIYDLAQFKVPKNARARKWTDIGLAVVQAPSDPHGRTGIVIIFAR